MRSRCCVVDVDHRCAAGRSRSPPRRPCAGARRCPSGSTSRRSRGRGAAPRTRSAGRSPSRARLRARRRSPPRTGWRSRSRRRSWSARNAFDAYLIISADAGSVTRIGAWISRYTADTRTATSVSSQPMTTRCGARVSRTACPSRRNSGFDATPTSVTAPADLSTRADRVGGTDRHRRLVHDDRARPQHRRDLPRDAFDDGEIGGAGVRLRRLHADEHELGAAPPPLAAPTTNAAGPTRSLRGRARARPSSRIGTSPFDSARTRVLVDVGAHDVVAQVGEARRGRDARRTPRRSPRCHSRAPTNLRHKRV